MRKPEGALRTGFTTGACAAAAAVGAAHRLWRGARLPSVRIELPKGETPRFELTDQDAGGDWARAAVVKDAGDDPDVTHGALIRATVRRAAPGDGLVFRAGEGVGQVTKPGLPLAVGEPAINPAPRALIEANLTALARSIGRREPLDLVVEISVPGGEALALKTWNPRLGVVGGISILGTTGIVKPYSCAAWIASIHRGVDVARASGAAHVAAATGSTSERAVAQRYAELPEWAFLDMGDFAGGLLKYLRQHPIPRLSVAGGFAKLVKLGQGALDLHSGRSQVDFADLATWVPDAQGVAAAETAMAALQLGGPALAAEAARRAQATAREALGGADVDVEVLVVDRAGEIAGVAPFERGA